eukprot:363547-Chlamydomonas_euryale.AAC.12
MSSSAYAHSPSCIKYTQRAAGRSSGPLALVAAARSVSCVRAVPGSDAAAAKQLLECGPWLKRGLRVPGGRPMPALKAEADRSPLQEQKQNPQHPAERSLRELILHARSSAPYAPATIDTAALP